MYILLTIVLGLTLALAVFLIILLKEIHELKETVEALLHQGETNGRAITNNYNAHNRLISHLTTQKDGNQNTHSKN
ncbi:MAG: hypothetical protein H7Y13_02380 [Sphingobacteriaceae bacterium]|nr:hypothetical protein [Sphingobacteriaceae bacterium]